MYRGLTLVRCIAVILFGGALQAQANSPSMLRGGRCAGVQKMESKDARFGSIPRLLLLADIQGVQPATDTNYGTS